MCKTHAWLHLAAPSVECHGKDSVLGVQRRTAPGAEVPQLPAFPEDLRGRLSRSEQPIKTKETTPVVSRPGKAPDIC